MPVGFFSVRPRREAGGPRPRASPRRRCRPPPTRRLPRRCLGSPRSPGAPGSPGSSWSSSLLLSPSLSWFLTAGFPISLLPVSRLWLLPSSAVCRSYPAGLLGLPPPAVPPAPAVPPCTILRVHYRCMVQTRVVARGNFQFIDPAHGWTGTPAAPALRYMWPRRPVLSARRALATAGVTAAAQDFGGDMRCASFLLACALCLGAAHCARDAPQSDVLSLSAATAIESVYRSGKSSPGGATSGGCGCEGAGVAARALTRQIFPARPREQPSTPGRTCT